MTACGVIYVRVHDYTMHAWAHQRTAAALFQNMKCDTGTIDSRSDKQLLKCGAVVHVDVVIGAYKCWSAIPECRSGPTIANQRGQNTAHVAQVFGSCSSAITSNWRIDMGVCRTNQRISVNLSQP